MTHFCINPNCHKLYGIVIALSYERLPQNWMFFLTGKKGNVWHIIKDQWCILSWYFTDTFCGIILHFVKVLDLETLKSSKRQNLPTNLLWNITTPSASRSLRSSLLPFLITSGCLRTSSQPMWAKKNPLRALWGSALVSENLWWTRWSLAHS